MENNLAKRLDKARRSGVPVVCVDTADSSALIAGVLPVLNGGYPVIRWDCLRGLQGLNEAGRDAANSVLAGNEPEVVSGGFTDMLRLIVNLPEWSLVFADNAHLFLSEPAAKQGLKNVRDVFKSNNRVCVLLGNSFSLPVELSNDVVPFSDPLPDDTQIKGIVSEICEPLGIVPDLPLAVEALRGLSAFACEQATALCLSKQGLDIEGLWARKRKQVENTAGLRFLPSNVKFSDLGGLTNIKSWFSRFFSGPAKPSCIVFIDEIEKALSGATGGALDGGVSKDQLGVLLTALNDNGWGGNIAVGPAGTDKSYIAQSLSGEFGCPAVCLDLGETKGGIVGESEGNIRAAVKTIKAMAGPSAFFIATCNRLESLPPELKRRFRSGIWFFDLPSEDERLPIWMICADKFGVTLDPVFCARESEGWSSANIRDCVYNMWALGCDFSEARGYIIPAVSQDAESIEKLRALASGRFFSASYSGAYRFKSAKEQAAASSRRVSLEG